jgi:hypothetical protein
VQKGVFLGSARTHVGVEVGDGLVARFGEALVLVADVAQHRQRAEELLEAVEAAVSGTAPPGPVIAARLAAIIANGEPGTVPSFGVVAPLEDGYLVLLHGGVSAEITGAPGVLRLSGEQAVTWVDQRVQVPVDRLSVTCREHPIKVDPMSDLRAGLVPGSGFLLIPGGGSGSRYGEGAGTGPAATHTTRTSEGPADPGEATSSPQSTEAQSTEAQSTEVHSTEVHSTGAQTSASPSSGAENSGAQSGGPEVSGASSGPAASAISTAGTAAIEARPAARETVEMQPTEPAGAEVPDMGTKSGESQTVPPAGEPLVAEPLVNEPLVPEPADDPAAGSGDDGRLALGNLAEPARSTEALVAPVGHLISNDGVRIPLDRDYVLGREPEADPAVMSGAATPVRLSDEENLISRVHSYIGVESGEVSLRDAPSANGTYVAAPGDEDWTSVGTDPVVLAPTWSLRVGNRIFTYVATGNL